MQDSDIFTVVSSDKQEIQVTVAMAKQSVMLRDLIVGTESTSCRFDGNLLEGVPVMNSGCLKRVFEYCKYHAENPVAPEEPKRSLKPDDMCDWDKEFVSEERLEQKDLFDLILAAGYLNIGGLTDITCKSLANRLKGKNPQEIVTYFKAVYPFDAEYTQEEEEAIRKEHPWIENPNKKVAATAGAE